MTSSLSRGPRFSGNQLTLKAIIGEIHFVSHILLALLLLLCNTIIMNEESEIVSFSVKGQIVIPRKLRKQLEIEDGTRALVYIEDDKIVLKPLTERHVRSLRTLLKPTE